MVNKVLPKIATAPRPPAAEDSFEKLVGAIGRWQLLLFSSIFLIKLPSGWIQMSIVFLTQTPLFWCVEFASNRTGLGDNGTCYRDCVEYAYDASPMDETLVTQWGLVCDRAWLASFTQTVLQLGILCGSIIFGFISDRYGRKVTFLIAVTLMIGIGLGVPFSPNYVVFTGLRFLLGVATAGTMVVSFVIIMEIISPRYRELFGSIYQIPFIIGHLLVPLVAYLHRTWGIYLLALGCTNLIFVMYYFILCESPRWLLSVGKVDEATEIVTKAAKMNNLPTTDIHGTLKNLSIEIRAKDDQPKLNYMALLHPELRARTGCVIVMWLIAGHTFFGFNQYVGQTSPDPFLSVAVAALVQIPAIFLSVWMMKLLGRKVACLISFLGCGSCIIVLSVVPRIFTLTLILGSVGICFASAAATCIYVYTSELYPTVVRNMAFGISSMSMRIGSMIAPFASSLSSTAFWIPTVLFGTTPIIAGLIVILLPETKGRKLPDTIEDIKIAK